MKKRIESNNLNLHLLLPHRNIIINANKLIYNLYFLLRYTVFSCF